ncbi:MAG: DUF1905 domain-containing protein [Candidatus Gracilibacteria bacterium]
MKAKIWLWPGEAAWHFVTLPKKEGIYIKDSFGALSKGFGSLPVKVIIGETEWKTSIFPDKKSGSYVLPVKANVRKKEGIKEGDNVVFRIEIRDIF